MFTSEIKGSVVHVIGLEKKCLKSFKIVIFGILGIQYYFCINKCKLYLKLTKYNICHRHPFYIRTGTKGVINHLA